MYIILNSY